MTIKEKNMRKAYPNTKWFEFYNENPQEKFVGDCSIRAYCGAMNITWSEAVKEISEEMIATGEDYDGAIDILLIKHGFKKVLIKVEKGKKRYTGKTFCNMLNKEYPTGTRFFISIGGHHSSCIREDNGVFKVHDIWDCSDNCINKAYYR